MKSIPCAASYSEETGMITITIKIRVPKEIRRKVQSSAVLTSRQRQIANMTLEGKTQKEISADLNIAVRTVKYHMAETWKRLGIDRAAGLSLAGPLVAETL